MNPKIKALLEQIEGISKAAVEADREFTSDERGVIQAKMAEIRDLKAADERKASDHQLRQDMKSLGETLGGPDEPSEPLAPGHEPGKGQTLGERFTDSPEVKAWMRQVAPSGEVMKGVGIQSPPVGFKGLSDMFGSKALVTGTSDTSAGALVTNDRLPGIVQMPFRELTVRDLITVGQTTSDTVEYVRVTGYTNNAAPVAEATATSGTSGTKPESAMALDKVTEPVRTIAHWIPATRRALSDAGQIRTLIDNFLRFGLAEELEDQILTGNGTGENLRGILNTSGIQALAFNTDLLVTARRARTLVRTVGRATPTAYLFNPADSETVDLMKDANGQFYFGGPATMGVNTLWGLPRVESEGVPAGIGIVADWRQAVLWDREQANILVSDSHADFFIRNMIAILAELRAAFGILRPLAFVRFGLTAGTS